MILKQKAFQKLAQIMKLKENQEKKPHPGIESEFNKTRCAWSGTVQRQYHSATLPSMSEVL